MKETSCDQDFLELIIEVAQDPDWIPEEESSHQGENIGLLSLGKESCR